MRVATWNVNSLKARLERVLEWLDYARPDVLCLQETKLADDAVPAAALRAAGYEVLHHGEGRWNGVAIVSRVGIEQERRGFGNELDAQGARLVAATCGGIRVMSVYVPNGREVGSEHYVAKLRFLEGLRALLEHEEEPSKPLVLCGDFNIAPEDRDVWDPVALEGMTHVSEPERQVLRHLMGWGLEDVLRLRYDDAGLYTWWDYRGGAFHRHQGMRIDLILATKPLAERVTFVLVDRNARKGREPSDHAPLLADFAFVAP
jgi:exodeoxyribonuclease-3